MTMKYVFFEVQKDNNYSIQEPQMKSEIFNLNLHLLK